jgi:hypothetical protein
MEEGKEDQCKSYVRDWLYLNTFSMSCGMILERRLHDSSKHGLVFTSINQGLNYSSTMKSRPSNSKLLYSLRSSRKPYVARTASVPISFIFGRMSTKKFTFSFLYVFYRYLWKSQYDSLLPFSYLP